MHSSLAMRIGWLLGGPFCLAAGRAVMSFHTYQQGADVTCLVVGITLMVLGLCVWTALVWQAWACIQDQRTSLPAPAAALLLLVPGFNVFWIFRVIGLWSGDFNAFAARQALPLPRQSGAWPIAGCVAMLCLGIPWAALYLALPAFIIMSIAMLVICDGVEAVYRVVLGINQQAGGGGGGGAGPHAAATSYPAGASA